MNLFITLALAVVAYTGFGIFTAKAGGKIGDLMLGLLTNVVASAVLAVAYVLLRNKSALPATRTGYIYACLAGLAIGAFSFLVANLFNRAENISFIMPVIYGATLVLVSIIGLLFFKDHATPLGLIGLAVTALGIGLVVYSRLQM